MVDLRLASPLRLERELPQLDPTVVDHRESALAALEELVEGPLAGAAELVEEAGDNLLEYMSQAAKTRISGLALGFITQTYLDESIAPAAMEEAVEAFGVEGLSAEERGRFQRAWLVREALTAAGALLALLASARPDGERVEVETTRLRGLPPSALAGELGAQVQAVVEALAG